MSALLAKPRSSHKTRTSFVLASLLSGAAMADDNIGAQHNGEGGTAIAHPRTNAAITLNPGILGLTERYDVEFVLMGGGGPAFRWGISAMDARTNDYISFGLTYNGALTSIGFLPDELPGWAETGEELKNRKQKHELTAALAANLFDRRLGFGINGTLAFYRNAFGGNRTTGNLDVGLAGRPIDYLTLGFAARDLVPIKGQVDSPAKLAFGLRGGLDTMITGSFEIDYRLEHVVQSPLDYRAGVEGTIRDVFKVRGGWNLNGDTAVHGISLGFGLFAKDTGTLNYSFNVPVTDPNLKFGSTQHTLSLTLFTKAFDDDTGFGDESPIRWPDER